MPPVGGLITQGPRLWQARKSRTRSWNVPERWRAVWHGTVGFTFYVHIYDEPTHHQCHHHHHGHRRYYHLLCWMLFAQGFHFPEKPKPKNRFQKFYLQTPSHVMKRLFPQRVSIEPFSPTLFKCFETLIRFKVTPFLSAMLKVRRNVAHTLPAGKSTSQDNKTLAKLVVLLKAVAAPGRCSYIPVAHLLQFNHLQQFIFIVLETIWNIKWWGVVAFGSTL